MKIRQLLSLLLILCCFSLSAQNNRSSLQLQSIQSSLSEIELCQQNVQQQLDSFEHEVDLYRQDVRAQVTRMPEDMSRWLVILSVIVGLIGVILGGVVPFVLNIIQDRRYDKALDDLKTRVKEVIDEANKAEQAKLAAEQALTEVSRLQETVIDLQKQIAEDKEAAQKAATEAEYSRLLTSALAESDPQKAIELLDKYISLNPTSHAYNSRGIRKSRIGNNDGALQDFDKAIEIDPNNAVAFYNRGKCKSNIGDKNGALRDYDKAIELNPNYAQAYNNRGACKSKLGDKNGALRDYDNAIKLNPMNPRYYRNRANIYEHLAKGETNDGIKRAFISKAKADRNKADSLDTEQAKE